MKIEQFNEGQEILKLIEVTQKGLDSLKALKPAEREEQRIIDDKLYNLHISEHSDGSGKSGELSRYYGNAKLLKVIINELERQLAEFKVRFDTL